MEKTAFEIGVEAGLEKVAISAKLVGKALGERSNRVLAAMGKKPGAFSGEQKHILGKAGITKKYQRWADGGRKGVVEAEAAKRMSEKGWSFGGKARHERQGELKRRLAKAQAGPDRPLQPKPLP